MWIGLISYPLYLWHWLLLSLTVTIFGKADAWAMRERKVCALVASFFLAWITWRFIENNVRRRKGNVATWLVLAMAALGLAGYSIHAASGVASHRPGSLINGKTSYVNSLVTSSVGEGCYIYDDHPEIADAWYCTLGDRQAGKWIIATGDSHSVSMLPALDRYGRIHDVKIVYAGGDGCLMLPDVLVLTRTALGKSCNAIARNFAGLSRQQLPSAIVFVQRWSMYANTARTRPDETSQIALLGPGGEPQAAGNRTALNILSISLRRALAFYREIGVPVVLIKDNPQQVNDIDVPLAVLRFSGAGADEPINRVAVDYRKHVRDQSGTNRLLDDMEGKYPGVTVLDIDPALCRGGICPWVKDGRFLYRNDDHLSSYGAMQVFPLLTEHLDRVLGERQMSGGLENGR